MLISDQSNVTSQVALPVSSLTNSPERERQTAPTHPSNKTGYPLRGILKKGCYFTDKDPSLPNYEDAMAMRMAMQCMRNTSTLPTYVV